MCWPDCCGVCMMLCVEDYVFWFSTFTIALYRLAYHFKGTQLEKSTLGGLVVQDTFTLHTVRSSSNASFIALLDSNTLPRNQHLLNFETKHRSSDA
ncbi:hypothetical protein FPOAC1_011526 [Fusarium poae]|uniref:hypothetical protein n=1 Tax=Fusarium poae TaxID=36050 RepID=UPI001CE93907|nr:hypothetical protein FPOAC1_011526 [Fusarium poae]KAG8666714.1 hypothetical protein FPOAC1_011526 [Fusarium poae]